MSDLIKIIKDKCVGCALCVPACPFAAITMIDKKAVIDLAKCTICGACKEVCKFDAIEITKPQQKTTIDLSDYKDVWVFIEKELGKIAGVSFELLGKAQELAKDLNGKVVAVFLGDNIKEEAKTLISRGADKVIVVERKELGQ